MSEGKARVVIDEMEGQSELELSCGRSGSTFGVGTCRRFGDCRRRCLQRVAAGAAVQGVHHQIELGTKFEKAVLLGLEKLCDVRV